MRSRLSAAYKGINVLVLREGGKDFFLNETVQELDNQGIALDIHHVFPRKWCREKGIKPQRFDNIINKTPISPRANRMLGGDAPSKYLERLQNDAQARFSDEQMDEILKGHRIPAPMWRADDFDGFYEGRRERLLRLIENAMGKTVTPDDTLSA